MLRDTQKEEAPPFFHLVGQSAAFPICLHHTHPPVKALYGLGNAELLSNVYRRIAIVGTRKPTAYGRRMAYDIAKALGKAGVCVVSGMALGVDAQAHRGALESGGMSIAVLASGVDHVYPKANASIYNALATEARGLLLSEYPAGTLPKSYQFPQRNRIISAIAEAVIVIEAAERSGALITATHALEQGVSVYALPGPVTSPMSAGTNRLISEGAMPILSSEWLLDEVGLPRISRPTPEHLSSAAQVVYTFLKTRERGDIRAISEELNIEISIIQAAINELVFSEMCTYISLMEVKLL